MGKCRRTEPTNGVEGLAAHLQLIYGYECLVTLFDIWEI